MKYLVHFSTEEKDTYVLQEDILDLFRCFSLEDSSKIISNIQNKTSCENSDYFTILDEDNTTYIEIAKIFDNSYFTIQMFLNDVGVTIPISSYKDFNEALREFNKMPHTAPFVIQPQRLNTEFNCYWN